MKILPSRESYTPLLVSMLALFILAPLVKDKILIRYLLSLFFIFTLAAGIYAVGHNKKYFYFALVFGGFACALEALKAFGNFPIVYLLSFLVEIPFFLLVTWVLFNRLLRARTVTGETIIGAICVYFLLGIAWALVHYSIELINPGSYRGLGGIAGEPYAADRSLTASFFYYSFVTLTTVGYGDITPVAPICENDGCIGRDCRANVSNYPSRSACCC